MVLWTFVIILTAVVCLTLYFAGKSSSVNADGDTEYKVRTAHLRRLHDEIDADVAANRISEIDAEAAKGELAREYLSAKKANDTNEAGVSDSAKQQRWLVPATLVAIVIGSFGFYTMLGSPDLPGLPLSERKPAALQDSKIVDAIAQVEARLAEHPDDVRGWQVLAPIYMRSNRFADAANAYRHILELLPVTADAEVDLAEALMMANGGAVVGEPLALLQSAAARDPKHIRSRFYLAGEATQSENFSRAIKLWEDLLALANGDEPWVETAREGLAFAKAGAGGGVVTPLAPDADQRAMIETMVAGLSERLLSDGGSLDEWTRLVRSRLVLGQADAAQDAYDRAKLAFPDSNERRDLDAMALQNNLK